jgi:hypothetical protein
MVMYTRCIKVHNSLGWKSELQRDMSGLIHHSKVINESNHQYEHKMWKFKEAFSKSRSCQFMKKHFICQNKRHTEKCSLKQHDFSDLGPSISETTSSLRDYILNPLHSSSLQAELGSAPVPALGIVPARQNWCHYSRKLEDMKQELQLHMQCCSEQLLLRVTCRWGDCI